MTAQHSQPITATPAEYLKIKYSAPTGACKCGNCQLVPPEVLQAWAARIEELENRVEYLQVSEAGQIAALKAALLGTVNLYVELVNSGDAGFWDPEKVDEVKQARAALKGAS